MIARLILGLAAAAPVPTVLALLPMLHLAPNRLVTGTPLNAATALGPWLWPVAGLSALGLGLLALGRGRGVTLVAGLACAGAASMLLIGVGAGASAALANAPPAARARLAAGAWIILILLASAVTAAARRAALPGGVPMAAAGLGGLLAILGIAGHLDALSLAQELQARRSLLGHAIIDHLALSCGALLLALLATLALGSWRRGRGAVDLAVSGVQVVPAIALFGGLVASASALLGALPALRGYGFSALGTGPALTGIAAYLLLPLWRGLQAALRAPDGASLDAARALGLSPRQILTDLRLPLGAPVLVGGLRVATVQALGLATLGALVGAGGLGTLVFDGMAQFAPDLILLGALPVIALSLAAETGLRAVEAAARRRWPQ
ncbi:MAG TPA: ABC transporter permease subunit [Methylorubrum populi]|uniref:ABC transporter permease subunit n=1 Tax=Methylorubrum populi TaxID=223967 RepID=A0A921JGI7_9HYPH|nr:ABC transporter permease subunit [Methylorubrum populi]